MSWFTDMRDPGNKKDRRLRRRWVYFVCVILVVCLGLVSRSEFVALPPFLAKYGGDALWALLVFVGFGFLLPGQTTLRLAGMAALFSCAIEFSQLYQAPWIEALRSYRLGALILGTTFAWADMGAYAVGIAAGAAVEYLVFWIAGRGRGGAVPLA